MPCVLHTTYFGPVSWYSQLYRSEHVCIDPNERWQKQTIRNRCRIATANGIQTLSVPIVHDRALHPSPITHHPSPTTHHLSPTTHHPSLLTRDIRISNHGKWRREHWNALQSAYGESPFFDYYADDLRPFFEEEWEYLFDFNLAIINKVCQLINGDEEAPSQPPPIGEEFNIAGECMSLQRGTPPPEGGGGGRPYYQVYQRKHGFIPDLSILDLLFNMGNEAILYL